jgi:hypothetical protein
LALTTAELVRIATQSLFRPEANSAQRFIDQLSSSLS